MNYGRPTVSIIIPNYNHGRYLRQRVDSVRKQTFQNFELILLDDCSTDESRTILAEYANDPRVRTEFNQENSKNTFKQWKKGIALATGKYIWVAESDDFADAQMLGELVSRLDADPEVVFCNCRSYRVNSDGEIIGTLDSFMEHLDSKKWTEDFVADGRDECRKYLVRCNTVSNASSVLFRKETYDRVGGVDETLRMCGDWKLWAAMALEGKIAYVGGIPLNYYRQHAENVTNAHVREGIYAAEYLQVVRWIAERAKPTKDILKKLSDEVFPMWSSKVLTNRVSFNRRWNILMNACAVDPRALRRLVRPGMVAMRLSVSRRLRTFRSASHTS
jgi:glycosyltransferase involved in cell wall biosynthesis